MRRFNRLLILLLAWVISASWGAMPTAAAPGSAHLSYLPLIVVQSPTFEERIVIEVNRYRIEAGLAPLTMRTPLMNAAEKYSAAMAAADEIGHDVDGSNVGDRISAEGYVWSACGEAVGAGYATPESVVAGWMNSPGHREIILTAGYTDVGAGYVYEADSTWHHFWTLDLATPG